jgi:MHS family proline/betaine transporter-like MFS transporter
LLVCALAIHVAAGFNISFTFMPTYLGMATKLDRGQALQIVSAGLVAYAVVSLLAGRASDRFGRRPLFLTSAGALIILLLPLFRLASSGDFASALLAELCIASLVAVARGPLASTVAEAVPTNIRTTVVAMGIAIALVLFGGFAPFVATYLISKTESPMAPALYGIGAGTITFIAA